MNKSMAKNATFNMINRALSVIFPLITISYASRILGPAGIGNVSSAQNIVTYFVIFASLGIPAYGVRAIAQNKKHKNLCNRTFTELFLINFVSCIVSFTSYLIVVLLLDEFQKLLGLHILFGMLVIFNTFNVEWVYQAYEEYKYITIRSFIIKLISFLMLILFVKKSTDIISYAFIVCFGTVGNYVLNMLQLKKYVKFEFKELCFSRHFKSIMVFFASVIAIELYSLVDVTMLTYMANSDNIGYYANASKIIKTISGTITAIGATLLPRLTIYFYEGKNREFEQAISKTLKIILILTIPACIGIMLVSNKIVFLMFGESFISVARTMCILSPLIILMPLSAGIASQILQTSNNEKYSLVSVCVGAIINLILNFLLIPVFLENGAAIASVITETFVTILMLMFSNKVIKINIEKKFILSIIYATTSLIFIVIICDIIFNSLHIIINLFLQILLGMISYFGILIINKNDIMMKILEMVNGKKCKI